MGSSYFLKKINEEIPSGYVRYTSALSISGIQFEKDAARKFIHSKESQSLILEPEPDNPSDKNALRILGSTPSGSYFIGYIPKDIAQQVSASQLIDKIRLRLLKVYEGKSFLDVTFHIVGPKSDRAHFESFAPVEAITPEQREFLLLTGVKLEKMPSTAEEANKSIRSDALGAHRRFSRYLFINRGILEL